MNEQAPSQISDFSVWVPYDETSGRIVKYGSCPEADMVLQTPEPGQQLIRGMFPYNKFYIVLVEGQPVPTARPAVFDTDQKTIAPGEVLTLTGIAPGTLIHVITDGYLVDDGVFEFSSDLPGEFALFVAENFPQQDQWMMVTVK